VVSIGGEHFSNAVVPIISAYMKRQREVARRAADSGTTQLAELSGMVDIYYVKSWNK
jgi:hypothetical protein